MSGKAVMSDTAMFADLRDSGLATIRIENHSKAGYAAFYRAHLENLRDSRLAKMLESDMEPQPERPGQDIL